MERAVCTKNDRRYRMTFVIRKNGVKKLGLITDFFTVEKLGSDTDVFKKLGSYTDFFIVALEACLSRFSKWSPPWAACS